MARAGDVIRKGGVVIFPAKCLYGIAVDALNPEAVARVFEVKRRPRHNPILVLVNGRQDLDRLVKRVPETAVALMDRFWPGNVTIVFEAVDDLPGVLTAHTGKIGIRMPHHPVARALVKQLGTPMTGTSANISGDRGISRVQDLAPDLVTDVDLVLDAGELKGGKGSTVVDVTGDKVRVLRVGEVAEADILEAVAKSH
ncbi:MAG: threonylcarbamoyl-AMP synthase [Desulfobacteraceae bacterium]|nr:threonylcarbamoyl-AMP synthase [Desulfobacteraceae bacterium]